MTKVPNSKFCYLTITEAARAGLAEEYERAAIERLRRGESVGPDNPPKKEKSREDRID